MPGTVSWPFSFKLKPSFLLLIHAYSVESKLDVYRKTEFPPIPCVVLVVDGEVKYAGNSNEVEKFLDEALEGVYPREE